MKSFVHSKSTGSGGPAPASAAPKRSHQADIRHALAAPKLQARLTVNQPGDEHEREADRVADEVTRGHASGISSSAPPAVLRTSEAGAPAPSEAPRSVQETLRSPGRPLERPLRERLESRFGVGFGGVRIHTGGQASDSARAISARAYTLGSHIAFGEGQYAPGTAEGDHLLAHELTHVVQQGGETSPGVVRRAGGAGRSRNPFTKVLKLHADVAARLESLSIQLKGLPNPTKPLQERIDSITDQAQRAAERKDGAEQVVDAWVNGLEIPVAAPVDALNYIIDDKPSNRGLAMLERTETNTLSLIDLVSPRVTRLSDLAEALGPDAPTEIREAFHTVAGYYLDLLPRAGLTTVFDGVTFLDTFYKDPALIQSYGIWAYIRAQIPDLYNSLLQAAQGGVYTFSLGKDLKNTDPRFGQDMISDYASDKGMQGKRGAAIASTVNALRDLKGSEERIGTLPRSLDTVGASLPATETTGLLQAFTTVQVRVAVLQLWQPIDPLRTLLNSHLYAGTSLLPFSANDRKRWENELVTLEGEYWDEVRSDDHPDIGTKVEGWQKRVKRLIDEIPPEVRTKKIIAAIVEQLPFMFVAGATAARFGLWVRAATQSKWLVALAEGATMTAFSAASIPANAPNRPQGVAGWTANLVVNVLLARVGRAFFEIGDAAARVAFTRSLIASFGARVVLPTVGLSALQTGVQLIEAKVQGTGGETGFTELLTLNLALNGIGMALGAVTMVDRPATPGTPGASSGAIVKATAADLAKQLNIPSAEAQLLLEVAAKLGDYQAAVATLNEAAAKGTLSRAQFEAFKKQGLDLADFLEARLGPLAKAGAFGATTPDQAKAFLAMARARLNGLTWEAGGKVTALLPEATTGLVRVGDAPQWVYDRGNPPAGLARLRADYEKRGNTVRALPSGGWEATDGRGNLLAQVIPVNAQAAQALSKNLSTLAKGPLAQKGLATVRAQTGIPSALLEAQLQQAASTEQGARAIPRVLQHLARFVEPTNNQAWIGLSQYLTLEGDPQILARSLAYGQPKEFAAESRLLANRLLSQMADWDADAVTGFELLYKLKPGLTAERLNNLVGDFEPAQVKGILQSLAVLEPRSRGLSKVIGPLTSGAVLSERGAMGALTAGVQLAEEHKAPNVTLVFEEPVTNAAGEVIRVTDISVQETRKTRVAGVEKTETVEIDAVEVKEVSTSSLGKRADQELARDIARDSAARAQRLTPVGASRPFFETFTWRIRGNEIREQATKALGNPAATPQQIDARMRDIVEGSLKKVFDRPEFKKLPQAEQDGYRKAFKGVPFVVFF
jgi:hypothetical protein